MTAMISTQVSHHINAPRDAVYQALLDARSIANCMVPDGMTSQVHVFDPCEGGVFRISVSYATPAAEGKTTPKTDTFHGLFVKLVPGKQVVQLVEFETFDPEMRGEMTVAITLADSEDGGTELQARHEQLPPGLSPRDNETGWRMSLAKLAALLERTMQCA
jgi:uncharacterized protein YndB with AHSA1/START domain